MTTVNSISQETIEQIDLIFTCIASNAATIKTLTYEILESGTNLQNVGALADALECVASSIGYKASEGLRKLGLPHDDAEHWFLPPLLQNTDAQQSAGSAPHA